MPICIVSSSVDPHWAVKLYAACLLVVNNLFSLPEAVGIDPYWGNVFVAQDLESMVYHRLDLGQLPAEKTCLHFQQLASFSTSALFLSPQAFEKPYEHVSQPETKTMIQNYIAYLSDSSTYISKPGKCVCAFNSEIRQPPQLVCTEANATIDSFLLWINGSGFNLWNH